MGDQQLDFLKSGPYMQSPVHLEGIVPPHHGDSGLIPCFRTDLRILI